MKEYKVGCVIPSIYSPARASFLYELLETIQSQQYIHSTIAVSFTGYPQELIKRFKPLIDEVVVVPLGTSLTDSRNRYGCEALQPYTSLDAIAHLDDDNLLDNPMVLHNACSLLERVPSIGMLVSFIIDPSSLEPFSSFDTLKKWQSKRALTIPTIWPGQMCLVPYRVHFKDGINQMWEDLHIHGNEDTFMLCKVYDMGYEVVVSPAVHCLHLWDIHSGMVRDKARVLAYNHDTPIMERRFGSLVYRVEYPEYKGYYYPLPRPEDARIARYSTVRYEEKNGSSITH